MFFFGYVEDQEVSLKLLGDDKRFFLIEKLHELSAEFLKMVDESTVSGLKTKDD